MNVANGSGRTPAFRALAGHSAWSSLVNSGVRGRHDAGTRVLRQGDPGGWVLLCVAGRIKVTYAEPDGRELMLAVRGPGDVLGEFSGRDGGPRSATVRAIESCVVSRLPDERFAETVARFGLDAELNRYILGKTRESSAHVWRMAYRRTPVRLAELLLTIVAAAGPDHRSPATVTLSQEELADALGLARSAITPVLAEWKETGLITSGRGRVEIEDLAGLSAVARSTGD
ncbi:CRP-like cAMP-binding protein [Saccharopolyspora lacisalsi]|uniref:CRP-like cAMP-binding protein n=1 Tax=Halosaccharopolyspora lacisalsi TaxID=1000566 RepID=A0A839DPU8_9PSEU|nr:Crp/Fnr family transcriptional regulator [Halosaccharopolyspora lacisalsi]MBA8823010.1 CRP-like cAMP-binding protein [Halosaccharopolyspora lacisalsi]